MFGVIIDECVKYFLFPSIGLHASCIRRYVLSNKLNLVFFLENIL